MLGEAGDEAETPLNSMVKKKKKRKQRTGGCNYCGNEKTVNHALVHFRKY